MQKVKFSELRPGQYVHEPDGEIITKEQAEKLIKSGKPVQLWTFSDEAIDDILHQAYQDHVNGTGEHVECYYSNKMGKPIEIDIHPDMKNLKVAAFASGYIFGSGTFEVNYETEHSPRNRRYIQVSKLKAKGIITRSSQTSKVNEFLNTPEGLAFFQAHMWH